MSAVRQSMVFDHLPRATKTLILINGIVFLAQFVFPSGLLELLALTPSRVFHQYYVWQVVTYSFLHAGFWHFFLNMFSLWMFGAHVENYWGTPTFLKYYFLCVIGAALTQSIFAHDVMVMGASGGIYGLLLAFGFLFPDVVMYLFFFFPLRAIQAVFVISLLTLFFSMDASGSRVAHLAHLGGLLTGYLYFKFPQWTQWIKRPQFHVLYPDHKQELTDLTHEVDRILEKISSHGVDSLTDKEKDLMKKYGESKKTI